MRYVDMITVQLGRLRTLPRWKYLIVGNTLSTLLLFACITPFLLWGFGLMLYGAFASILFVLLLIYIKTLFKRMSFIALISWLTLMAIYVLYFLMCSLRVRF